MSRKAIVRPDMGGTFAPDESIVGTFMVAPTVTAVTSGSLRRVIVLARDLAEEHPLVQPADMIHGVVTTSHLLDVILDASGEPA